MAVEVYAIAAVLALAVLAFVVVDIVRGQP